MNLVENFNKALQDIYDHVGFEESWVILPIDDQTHCYWKIEGTEITFADTEKELEEETGQCFKSELYQQHFYDKWIYEGKQFTMVFSDSKTDNMKYFTLFDNNKKHE